MIIERHHQECYKDVKILKTFIKANNKSKPVSKLNIILLFKVDKVEIFFHFELI